MDRWFGLTGRLDIYRYEGSKGRYSNSLESLKQRQGRIFLPCIPQDSCLLMLKVASALRSAVNIAPTARRKKAASTNHRPGIDVTVHRRPEQGLLKWERRV